MAGPVSRRGFAAGVLGAATAAATGADTAPSTEAPLKGEAQRQYEAILERHATQLSDAEKADVRRLLAAGVKGIEPLRTFPLENSDEPATIFRVWRADRA
jgi:hypothetical protein